MTLWKLGCLIACIAAGCSTADQSSSVEVGDSAGIVVLTNHQQKRDAPHIRIDSTPNLVLGGAGSELIRTLAAFQLEDGGLLVVDAGGLEITAYSHAGAILARAGGAGGGPGRFVGMSAARLLPGDTLEVWDGLRRRALYTSTLQLVLHEQLGDQIIELGDYGATPRLIDGASIVITSHTNQPEPLPGAVFRGRRLHRRIRLSDTAVDTLIEHDGGFAEIYVGNRQSHVLYFTPRDHLAIGPTGEIAVADGASHDILIFGNQSKPTRLIRRSTPLRRVTQEEFEAARSQRREALARTSEPQVVDRIVAAIPEPRHHPGIAGLVIDKLGYVWAAEPAGPFDDRTSWVIYNREGVWLEAVGLQGRAQLLEVGEDYLLALTQDELEQEYIVRYSVQRLIH